MRTGNSTRAGDGAGPSRSVGSMAIGRICLAVFALIMGTAMQVPAFADEPTLAVVETDKELAPLAALLTAQLSQEGVRLVERKQLDAVLQEQALSAAGLTDRANLVKVGALVRADAFVLLSLEKAEKGDLLRVRVAETAHGVRLMDACDAWDPQKADATAALLDGKLKGLVAKLGLPPGQVIAVGIMDVADSSQDMRDTQQLRCRA